MKEFQISSSDIRINLSRLNWIISHLLSLKKRDCGLKNLITSKFVLLWISCFGNIDFRPLVTRRKISEKVELLGLFLY